MHPARTAVPRPPLLGILASPAVPGKGQGEKEQQMDAEKWNNPPAPLFLGSHCKEERRCLEKIQIKMKIKHKLT